MKPSLFNYQHLNEPNKLLTFQFNINQRQPSPLFVPRYTFLTLDENSVSTCVAMRPGNQSTTLDRFVVNENSKHGPKGGTVEFAHEARRGN